MRRATRLPLCLALVVFGAGAGDARAQRYVAFGDSITEGFGDEASRGGYPARLDALLDAAGQTATVENRGVGGETTAEGLSRLSSVSGAAGDSLLLMEGTNDIAQRVSNETIVANLKAMARKGAQRGFGRVYLATVVPRGAGAEERGRVLTVALCEEIRQAAFEVGLPQPDPFQVFADVPNYRTDLFGVDPVHPNARGYDLLAEQFADQILGRDGLAPAPSFVTPEQDAENVSPEATLEAVLFDSQSGVDFARATLTVNGVAVATTVSGDPRRAVLRARPGTLVGRPLLGVEADDRAAPANRRIGDLTQFTVKGAQFLRGDVNRSGRVDGADLVVLARAFGTRSGEARYDADADLDENRRVDGADLAILAANFGLSSF